MATTATSKFWRRKKTYHYTDLGDSGWFGTPNSMQVWKVHNTIFFLQTDWPSGSFCIFIDIFPPYWDIYISYIWHLLITSSAWGFIFSPVGLLSSQFWENIGNHVHQKVKMENTEMWNTVWLQAWRRSWTVCSSSRRRWRGVTAGSVFRTRWRRSDMQAMCDDVQNSEKLLQTAAAVYKLFP